VTTDNESPTCTLCDLPVSRSRVDNERGEAFCCPGCRDVHARLDDVEGVDEGDVRGTLDDDAEQSDGGPPAGHDRAFLRVTGMHCTTCEAFIESVAARTDGIDGAEASYVTDTVRVAYDPDELTEEGVAAALSTTGYTATRRADASAVERAEEDTLWRLAAGVLMGMMVMLPYLLLLYPLHFSVLYEPWMREMLREMLTGRAAQYPFLFVAFFAALVLLYTGGPILRGAYVSLRTGAPNMDLLVALAAVSAYAYSTVAVLFGRLDIYYDITVVIVLVVTAGRYYESTLKRRATERLSELATTQVDDARLYGDDGTTTEVSVAGLTDGDRVLVRAGERIPVDGVVDDGECTVDEGIVSGESMPVVKREGDAVVGGSVLRSGASVVEVTDGGRSSIDRLVDLVYDIQSANHGVQKLVDRLAAVFVPLVVTVAVLAGGAYLLLGASVSAATLVTLTVLLVSCPCALGLATPMAVASGIRTALNRGIVVFDETVFERFRGVDVVVFDKTGTLTTGELDVHSVDAPEDLLGQAVALERRVSHPAADAIVRSLEATGAVTDGGTRTASTDDRPTESEPGTRVTEFESHATGVEGRVDGAHLLVGHPSLFEGREWSIPERLRERATAAREVGRLPVLLGRDGTASGLVVLGDEPREGWETTVEALHDRGMEVVVLTGDDSEATATFREHPHVDDVFAGVPPEAKAETVRRLGDGRAVAMVGDGTNDAPALASADLGVALGSGTALAVDAADVAIVDDDVRSLATAFDLSAAAGSRVTRNVGWALTYNAVAIPLALLGLLNPLFAAVAMASSSLLVVTNSSRPLLGSDAPGRGESAAREQHPDATTAVGGERA